MNDCFGGMGVYAVVSAEDSNEDWRKKKAKYQQLRVWEEFEERQLQNEKFLILWTATHPHFCTQGFTPAQPLRTHATSIDCIVPPYSHHSNMFYIFTYNILFWGRSVRISMRWLLRDTPQARGISHSLAVCVYAIFSTLIASDVEAEEQQLRCGRVDWDVRQNLWRRRNN